MAVIITGILTNIRAATINRVLRNTTYNLLSFISSEAII